MAAGVEGRTYSLYIETDTDTLTASTILPVGVPLVNPRFEAFESLDSLGFLFGTLVDPPEEGNVIDGLRKELIRINIITLHLTIMLLECRKMHFQ